MDMVLYALLKKEMQDFEYVNGYKIVIVSELPLELESDTIYIIDNGDDN